jgi:hypothetical protein
VPIQDVRGSWPCAYCDSEAVTKRGTICPACELRLDADHRQRKLDGACEQLGLEDPAAYGSVVAFRGMDTIVDPEGRI